jgi:hypothetical protein
MRKNTDELWWARMQYLFDALPVEIRNRWGGDVQEFVQGIDVARSWKED